MRAILLLFFLATTNIASSQDVLLGTKFWSGLTIDYKMNKRFNFSIENINSLNAIDGSFTFNQLSAILGVSLPKKFTAEFGYGNNLYSWNPSYNVYNLQVNRLNTIMFHNIDAGINHKLKITRSLRLKQEFVAQMFIPTLEKYQFRFQYKLKLYYYNKKAPIGFSPFLEPSVYFYMNGIPIVYRDQNNNIVEYKSPNGFHRMRIKVGFKITPFKKETNFSMIFYYMYQKEFNIGGIGNDINIISNNPSQINYPATPSKSSVVYPFNDYSVIGMHLLYYIKQGKK